jgi:prolyl oligopeptidase
VDEYHGMKVADPYRWLEEDVRQSEETSAWVEEQNELTFGYLDSLPSRDAIGRRLEELWDYERYSAPFKAGGRYYYSKNDGLQNQSVLYVMDSFDGEARVLLDPNTWSEDGTVTLGGMSASDDGRYLAYAVAEAGSDWRTWYVMEVESGELLPDKLEWMKFGGVTWTPDSRGFLYGSFDPPDSGSEYQGLNLNHKLYHHRLGTDRTQDVLVYAAPEHPEWAFFPTLTDDGRYLVIAISSGAGNKNRVVCRDLSQPLAMERSLVDDFDNSYGFVGNDGSWFYFVVDVDAPKSRLVAIDVENPGRENWREIISESEDTLAGVDLVGNLFVATYLDDAKTSVRLFRTNGKHLRDVELPTLGSAFGFGGERTDTETFYQFSSFATPPSIYRYDLITGESTLFRRAEVDFDPAAYEVSQVFYESKDGTRVPMFLVHKKGIDLDGRNATLLYGYGGFNVPLTPGFSISRLAWVDMGGVFAMPNLRGGGEYGEEWHLAGTRLNKQNVFDDFISAAEWLIEKGYTSPEKLAIQGGSNGGLLVGACLTQRPDLFGAALPAVGVMDMLRFHKFTAGRFWVEDYGSSDDPEEFKALLAYSPYHNLEPGTEYPATLVTTADHDDRVVPSHSFKFAAKLQETQAGDEPVLIRIETRAGHGGGTPTAKALAQTADTFAFVVEALGMELPESWAETPEVEAETRPRG